MRKDYFYSLIFALLGSASIVAMAAPNINSEAAPPSANLQTVTQAQPSKVDLNSAEVSTLQRELAGIGEAKAKAIVTYREDNGPFVTVDELLEVKGIGKAILERNRDKLQVN